MPAQSKKQQRFFGLVKAIQEGKATGSGKAERAAASMSEGSVRDFAKTKHKKLPESKNTMKKEAGGTWITDSDKKQLLQYAGISATAGLGVAGMYGLLKLLYDKSNLSKNRLKKYETRVSIPGSKFLKKEDKSDIIMSAPQNPSEMLSDDDSSQSELSPEIVDQILDPVKSSEDGRTWGEENLLNPYIAGALTPIAMILPGVATYHFSKKLIDTHRRSNLDKELKKAKKEFEAVLNKTASDLQKQVDDLATKKAWRFPGSSIWEAIRGTGKPEIGIIGAPPPPPPASSPGFDFPGIFYTAGIPVGVGALLGATLMNRKMKNEPERRELKELQKLLQRQIADKAQGSVIDIEKDEEGKTVFDL